MATTMRNGLRYPVLTDAPNGPQQIRNLAEDTEGWLHRAYPCLSTERPVGVGDGFMIRETDTAKLYIWNGTAAPSGAWEQLARIADLGATPGAPGQPGAAATYSATTTQTVDDETDAAVAFGTAITTHELVTRAGHEDGHKFALGESGIWAITATVRWARASDGGRTFELRTVSGVVLAKQGAGTEENAPWTANLSVVRRLASGTEVYVWARQDSGSDLAIEHGGGSYCHIDLALLG
ncbi:hypothetical protein ACU61A_15680 [Pseudonocardia sichuanensis]